MKTIISALLLIFCFFNIANGQSFSHEFGKYSAEEFNMKEYDKDPSAEAVVIYDIGKSYFIPSDEGLDLFFERKMKVKILKQAGIKWGEYGIPYYSQGYKQEEILELKGNTYNFDNGNVKITPLNPKNTFNEKINENWFEKKFAMPDVKVGSVIEISFLLKTPYHFNLRNWEFQKQIPVIYSEYTTKMTPFYEYCYILQGAKKFDEYSSYVSKEIESRFGHVQYRDMVYFFVMKDVPAFKDQAFISSPDDYILKLDFQLATIHRLNGSTENIMTTWPKLIEDMQNDEFFGDYLKSSKKKAKEFLDTMHLADKNIVEKTKKIEHFVKGNFSWNKENRIYAKKSIKDFLKTKTGNSSEINLFLTGMLNAAGIEAYPVMLSTRKHGKIKVNYPFLHFFNYVVAAIKMDSVFVLLDATDPMLEFNDLPPKCFNDKGLVIQKGKEQWLDIKSTKTSEIAYNFDIQLNLNKDSVLENCTFTTTGYEAIDYRYQYNKDFKKLKKELLGEYVSENQEFKVNNLNKSDQPFEIQFKKNDAVETVEDKIIVTPFCNKTISENPLKQVYRDYPIDFTYKKEHKFQSTIKIPDGYKLLKEPETLMINSDLAKIIYTSSINDNVVKVVAVYEFKKDTYQGIEYMDIKDYFNKIVDKFNEKLIFVKIK